MGRFTVSLMKFPNFESVVAILNDIVVAFVPTCYGCQLGSGKFGQRVIDQAINYQTAEKHKHSCGNTTPGK